MPGLFIMLPALDEADALPKVVGAIPVDELKAAGWQPRIVVVDGGSTDKTVKVAHELGCIVYHQKGRGKGSGMRQVFNAFLNSENDALVMLDADGTYDPKEIPLLLSKLEENCVVIGDRLRGHLNRNAMTTVNWLGNHMLTWLAVALFGKAINDLCSGYWAFSKSALSKMELNSLRFEIEAEMYTSCAYRDIRIRHVPISYSERIGDAKLGSLRDGGSIARKLIIRRIFPRPYEASK